MLYMWISPDRFAMNSLISGSKNSIKIDDNTGDLKIIKYFQGKNNIFLFKLG